MGASHRSWLLLVEVVLIYWEISTLQAVTTEANVDTLEPTVIRSPAMTVDRDDGFGWAAILHQIAPVSANDSMSVALSKTRCVVVMHA